MRSVIFSGKNSFNPLLAQFAGLNSYQKKRQETPLGQTDTFYRKSQILFSGKRKRSTQKEDALTAKSGPSDSMKTGLHLSLDPEWMMKVAAKTEPKIERFEDVRSLDDFSELSAFLRQLRATNSRTGEYLISKTELLNRRGLIFDKWLKMKPKIQEWRKKSAFSPYDPEYPKNRLFYSEYKYAEACYHLIDLELDRRDGKHLSAQDLEKLKKQVPGWLNNINTYNEISRQPIPWTPNTKNPYLLDLEKLSDEQLRQEQVVLGDQLNDLEKSGTQSKDVMDEKKVNKYRRLKAKYDVVDCLLDRRVRSANGKYQSNPDLEAEEAEELASKLSVIDGSTQLHSHLRFLKSLTPEALDNRLLNLSRKIHEYRTALPQDPNQDSHQQWLIRWDLARYQAEQKLGLLEEERRNKHQSMDLEAYWSQCQQEVETPLRTLHDYWKQKKEPGQLSEDSLQFLAKGASSFFDAAPAGQIEKEEIRFIREFISDIEDETKYPLHRLVALAASKKQQLDQIKTGIQQAVSQSNTSYQEFLSTTDMVLPEFDEFSTETPNRSTRKKSNLNMYLEHLGRQGWANAGVEVVPDKRNLNTAIEDTLQEPADKHKPLTRPVMGRSLFQDQQLQKKVVNEMRKLRAVLYVIKNELCRREMRNGQVDLSEKNVAKALNTVSDYWADLLT